MNSARVDARLSCGASVRWSALSFFVGVPPQVKPCFYAGFCVCRSVEGRDTCALVSAFQGMTMDHLAKGSHIRPLYNAGELVVHVCSPSRGALPDRWLHVSFGSLRTRMFTFLQLEPVSGLVSRVALAQGRVALAILDNNFCGAVNLWEAYRGVPLYASWSCRFHKLVTDHSDVYPPIVATVVVEPAPCDSAEFWKGESLLTHRPRRPGTPRAAGRPGAVSAAPAEDSSGHDDQAMVDMTGLGDGDEQEAAGLEAAMGDMGSWGLWGADEPGESDPTSCAAEPAGSDDGKGGE